MGTIGLRLLLDTHALIWWLMGDPALSAAARAAISDPASEIHVSAASAWEITTKYRIGKANHLTAIADDVRREVSAEGFGELPISMAHAQHAGSFAGAHKDPFDRMLIAQAMLEDLTLVSNETAFDAFGIRRLW